MNQKLRPGSKRLAVALLFVLCVALLVVIDHITREFWLDQLSSSARTALRTHVASLERELDKYEALPEVVALSPSVPLLLSRPADQSLVTSVNQDLQDIAQATGASDVYVMDAEGLTLAASNWDQAEPFVGQNFSYRPYFRDAMAGGRGKYFALGSTSRKRGYYFSYPVWRDAKVAGVSVVKVSMANLESAWSGAADELLVTDANGVVFLSSRPQWSFRTMQPLPERTVQEIEESRQYADTPLKPLALRVVSTSDGVPRVVSIADGPRQASGGDSIDYLLHSSVMPAVGWTVHLLSSIAPARRQSLASLLISGLALSLAFLALVYGLQRREHAQERRRLQDEAHGALQRAHETLEGLVETRTRELVRSNERLEREIEERMEAERTLRTTQDELVQAGKLAAVGQLAAEITHELNQPLTAIRGYADNARAYLERDRVDEAVSNISAIGDMTSRMAGLTRQLKTFARKSRGNPVEFEVAELFDSVLTLLEPRIRRTGIECRSVHADPSVRVVGDRLRLEQVLVNLCQNAIDAVADSESKQIELSTEIAGESVILRVVDSGKGIDESELPKLFEPYFTTKDIGEGLGLGLSISYGIIKEHRGTIVAVNRPEGGAQFTITLPRRRLEGEAVS